MRAGKKKKKKKQSQKGERQRKRRKKKQRPQEKGKGEEERKTAREKKMISALMMTRFLSLTLPNPIAGKGNKKGHQ